MRAIDAKGGLEAALAGRGLLLSGLDAESAADAMFDFYATTRAVDVDLEADGDMLLFQWGTHDWGAGESFEFDVTRQFILDSDCDDEAIWQLSLTLHFDPSPETAAIANGHRWCYHPDDLDEFRRLVRKSAAFALAERRSPSRVDLDFEVAG